MIYMDETGFKDMTGRKITIHSILLNLQEKMYFIVKDPELGICIQDTRRERS